MKKSLCLVSYVLFIFPVLDLVLRDPRRRLFQFDSFLVTACFSALVLDLLSGC
jgi:hypothetical protein